MYINTKHPTANTTDSGKTTGRGLKRRRNLTFEVTGEKKKVRTFVHIQITDNQYTINDQAGDKWFIAGNKVCWDYNRSKGCSREVYTSRYTSLNYVFQFGKVIG